jgi:hypothetical protein
MSSAAESPPREDLESQVWNAIAAFEQIVQALPNDRVSLDALSHAYEQVGDLTRAREYLVRLAHVVVEESDREAAETLRERLARFAAADPAAKQAEDRVGQLLSLTRPGEAVPGQPDPLAVAAAEAELPGSIVAAELSFAWHLLQAGEVTQDEYAALAQDLSEIAAAKSAVTISVLHVMHDRAFRNLERVVTFAARDSHMPLIPLTSFEIPEATLALLPLDFMERNGAVVFELLGTDALAAVLNPFNKPLQTRIEAVVRRKCHFFLALPADFDVIVEKLRDRIAKPAEGASGAAAQKA